jgi:hypothetical protein
MMLLLLMVVVEVCMTVDQLHDKILCTSHTMILQLFELPLVGALDCWNASYCCAAKQ